MSADTAIATGQATSLLLTNQFVLSIASGAIGGFLGAIVSLLIAMLQIKSNNNITTKQIAANNCATQRQIEALIKTNEENIQAAYSRMKEEMAERDNQYRREREDFLISLTYEERKKVCCNYLSVMNPENIRQGIFDRIEAQNALTLVQIYCKDIYYEDAFDLFRFVTRDTGGVYQHHRGGPTAIPFVLQHDLPDFKEKYDRLVQVTFSYLDSTRSGRG